MWIVSTHRRSRVNALARWTYVDLRESEQALSTRFLAERPQVLYGPLRALLSMGQEMPPLVDAQRPRVLIATAELLRHEDQRELKEIFGVNAADFYGMTEIGLFAIRPAGGRQYRIVADDVHVEYLPCAGDPRLERLVLTTLKPCAMPLIRYDTGDLVRRDHAAPGAPIIEFVGREIDGILLTTGKRVSPYRLTLALETVPNITRYQVVQRADLSVDVLLQTTERNAAPLYQKAQAAVAGVLGPGLTVRAGALIAAGKSIAEKFRPVRSYASPAR